MNLATCGLKTLRGCLAVFLLENNERSKYIFQQSAEVLTKADNLKFNMPITKQKKSEILDILKKQTSESSIILFVNFHGLNTVLTRELRKLMTGIEAKYLVAKKTLVKKVFSEEKISGNMPELNGEVAVVFGKDDVVLPPKSLAKFSKSHPELSVLGGIMDRIFLGKEDVLRLAKLPSMEILIAQFINVINAPRRQMVGVLQAPIRDFISVLSAVEKSKRN